MSCVDAFNLLKVFIQNTEREDYVNKIEAQRIIRNKQTLTNMTWLSIYIYVGLNGLILDISYSYLIYREAELRKMFHVIFFIVAETSVSYMMFGFNRIGLFILIKILKILEYNNNIHFFIKYSLAINGSIFIDMIRERVFYWFFLMLY